MFLGNHVLSPPLAGECIGSGPGCLGSDARSVAGQVVQPLCALVSPSTVGTTVVTVWNIQ